LPLNKAPTLKVTQQVIAGTTEAARICGATTISDSQVHSALFN